MINLQSKEENYLIKNFTKKKLQLDFSINAISIFFFILFLASGIFFYLYYIKDISMINIVPYIGFSFAFFLFLLIRKWELIIGISIIVILSLLILNGINSLFFSISVVTGGIIAPMIQIVKEWERAIILRLGKFNKVKGPGLFFIIPFIDSVNKIVDLRIRVTDFVAETTLTKDSVTVTVDALCFWLVWDPEKAILEVENYIEAVVLSSQTALRNAISKNTLSNFLENGDAIEESIREEVDKKTTEWGITVQHIEITDIQIPKELQDSMSRLAQAEREKKSRILLSEAEIQIAKKLEEASKIYKNNEIAIKLKNLSVINEGFKSGNSMILVPSDLPDELNKDNIFGLQALNQIKKGTKIKKQ